LLQPEWVAEGIDSLESFISLLSTGLVDGVKLLKKHADLIAGTLGLGVQ
jgi:hypothetical protein